MYVVAISSVFTGLAVLVVALRLYTRIHLVKAPGLDDLIIFVALLVDVAFYTFTMLERLYGIGIRASELSEYDIERQLFWLWLSVPFYNMTMILAKFSALTLYARLFRPRRFLLITYSLMGFLVIVGLWTSLSGFLFCIPLHAFWSPSAEVRDSNCLPASPVWFTNAALQTFTDLVILVLPLSLLWKLQLPRRQKWGILVVFGLGIFIVGASAARMYPLSIMVGGGDFTQASAKAALWSCLEANVSIICICLPPLHPLFSRIFSFFFLPRPIRSRASRCHSSRSPLNRDAGIWCNELFSPGTASYSASISKVDTNEEEQEKAEGIRVKRELRMQSNTVPSFSRPQSANGTYPDIEMTEGSGSLKSSEHPCSNASFERDFGDFEFPDYKNRMNAPI
ncbi:hypothetical protein CBS147333_9368 [Penicillium roqueforti]|nr:hypothetical protein CBS147333_9368 [Penicillium roqueforti]KAI3192580.1 hypothetical protein CBS147311_9145 [Penicillium roqueforti]KAI3262096.1 hypothetical protein CBS147308_9514 [Penicillium roqueforti]KAI3280987.1 hypothetical protein DTO003C3_9201 [Penicillium roqueforti]